MEIEKEPGTVDPDGIGLSESGAEVLPRLQVSLTKWIDNGLAWINMRTGDQDNH